MHFNKLREDAFFGESADDGDSTDSDDMDGGVERLVLNSPQTPSM